jgi:predicted deacylase
MPLTVISGNRPGPTLAVIAGMHGGEYAGIFAAQKLIQTVKPDSLSGRLIVVPVISSQAFMMR